MAVSFNTIDPNIRVPLFYAEMDNSQANSFSQNQKSLLIGQKTVAGKAEADIPLLVTSLEQARQLFGTHSMLARMYEVYRNIDTFGEVWCLPVDDSESGAVAKGTITVTGTAHVAGTLFLRIAGRPVRVGITKGMDAIRVATALAETINESLYLPVTATSDEAVVTLTAIHKGEDGNSIRIFQNYAGAAGGEQTPDGLMLSITAMTGGSGNPELSGAVVNMGDELYDFIGHPYTDTANLDTMQLIMNDTSGRWSYLKQIYGHCYTARLGTVSELNAFGKTRNDQHHTIAGIEPANPVTVSEYAAAYMARNAVFLRADPARPTQTGELNGILAAKPEDRFITEERQVLLNCGLATSYIAAGGVPCVERAITTYQKNKYGDPDTSYLDSETMFVSMTVLRRLRTLITSKYGRHKLANDGTQFGAGQAIVTPKIIRSELIAEYARMEEGGLVENAALFAKYLIVERDSDNPNRVNVLFPPDYVNQLRALALLNQFRQQYQE